MNYHWSRRFEYGWRIYIIIKIPEFGLSKFFFFDFGFPPILEGFVQTSTSTSTPSHFLDWYITTCMKYFIALQNWYIQFSPDAFACEYDIRPFFRSLPTPPLYFLSLFLPYGNPPRCTKVQNIDAIAGPLEYSIGIEA